MESALNRHHQRQETSRVGRPEEAYRHRGPQCLGTAEVVQIGGMASSRIKGPVIGPNHTDVGCIKRRATASAHAFSSSLQHVACCQGRQMFSSP